MKQSQFFKSKILSSPKVRTCFASYILVSTIFLSCVNNTSIKAEISDSPLKTSKAYLTGEISDIQNSSTLELNDVLTRIDLYHPSLQSTELNRQSARANVMEAQSQFIPKISTRTLLEEFKDEKFKTKRGATFGSEVSWQSPFAFEFIGAYRSTTKPLLIDDALTYNSSKAFFDSVKKVKLGGFTDDEISFGFRMPLLRGLLIDEYRASLKRSKLDLYYADYLIRQKRADLFLKASEKYWDWVAAGLQLNVFERLLSLTKTRAAAIKETVDQGARPPIDYIEAQGQIKSREEILGKALRNFEKESLALSLYIWNDEFQTSIPKDNNLPEKIKDPIQVPTMFFERHLELSQKERPEIKLLEIDKQQEQINLKLAKNNLLPKIDLEILPTQDLNRFENGTNIRGSLVAELPIYPLKAQSSILKSSTNLQKNNLNKELQKTQISNEIRDALSGIETSKQRIEASQEALRKFTDLQEGEEIRFNLGSSSVFFVNLREATVAEAENKLIEALAEHQKAIAKYRYSIGEWAIPGFDTSWIKSLDQDI